MARKAATKKAETETIKTAEAVVETSVANAEETVEDVKPAKRTRKTATKKTIFKFF